MIKGITSFFVLILFWYPHNFFCMQSAELGVTHNVVGDNKVKKVVIIHGNGGCTADVHWIPSLKVELESKGITVITPTMPDNVEAKASIWLPYMHDELQCDENTIVIGHSSGAVAAMRYAEEHKLLGSVLVSACYTDLGLESERLAGYYDAPWLWDKIKANQQWIIQFASIDDPYIPIAEARHIQKNLNTKYYEFIDQGHFMNKSIPKLSAIVGKHWE